MPQLVRMYIRHCLIGAALAVVFTAALIGFNVANLRHLVTHVQGGWLAVVMLVVFNTIVFAGVQFGIAIMQMAEKDPNPPGGRRARVAPAPAPVTPAGLVAVPAPAVTRPRR